MRRWLCIILLLLCLPGAAAHGDSASWQGSFSLDAGETVDVTRPVHWHRTVGTLRADGPVAFLVEGDLVAGPGKDVVVDHLVRCCDALWTDRTFTVQNRVEAPVEVRVEVAFLHDNLAVLVDDAEPGGWWQALFIVGLLIGIPAWRARQTPVPSGADWLGFSRLFHGATWTLAGLISLVGMVRFGTGPLVGSLAATAPVPGDVGSFFNTHSFVMLLLMTLWGTSYALWAGARRRRHQRRIHYDGIAFAAGPFVVGLLLFIEYGVGWIPAVLALLPALAVMADLLAPMPHADEDS